MRNNCRTCSIARRIYFERATELANSLSHPADSDSRFAGQLHLRSSFRRYAFTSILGFNPNLAVGSRKRNLRHGTAGMAMDVGQAFLYDTKDWGFDLARKAAEVWRDLQVHLNLAAFAKSFQKQSQSRG